jgi:hypothetical protein
MQDTINQFSLRFPITEVRSWADRYPDSYDQVVENIAVKVRERGYFTREDFFSMCHWKSPRSKPRVESNSAEYIEAVTRTALATPNERLRIEILTLLIGVRWPTASVLLHFGYADLYPILDFRALWSLGVDADQVKYDFKFWWGYTMYCRELAKSARVSMRVLDRALWQYSKENR